MDKDINFAQLQKSDKKVIVGIDEAGRGPVLGYMVYCAMVFEIDNIPNELKDSKQLTDKSRRRLFSQLQDYNFAYKALHPSNITSRMLSQENLNNISWFTVVELLTLVTDKYSNIECIYVDTIGNCDQLKRFLELKFPNKIVVEPKADVKYPVVSGASIIAKVVRDDALSKFPGNLGSGYPGDPNTKLWLKNNINELFGWGSSVRYTWATVKNMLGYNKSRHFSGRLAGYFMHSE
ncbi:ribonuclease H2 subunit A [Vairimorpha necatrix]|uniref:Ribonuclease n=1 Tax=Vairimorpha necatrix TaxID=6039 RepID=A0AAX4J8W4_9MICR